MGKEQILGLIRHILTFAGGILVSKGLIDETNSLELAGTIVSLVGTVWSVLSKKSV